MRTMMLHTRTLGLRNPAGASALADIDQDLARLRERLEAAIEGAIALLDRLDAPAEDLEDCGDWEPWLAAPEGHERPWGQWSPLRGRLMPGTSIWVCRKPG